MFINIKSNFYYKLFNDGTSQFFYKDNEYKFILNYPQYFIK